MPVSPCPSPTPQPQRGVVTFDKAEFVAKFPAFATVDAALLQGDFDVATLFLNNSCCSVVKDANKRLLLLYMVTAHIAALFQGENGNAPSGLIGRVSSGSEGSVAVSTQYASEMSMTEAYFAQTQYGAMFWAATTYLRTMRYVAPPQHGCLGRGGGYPWGSGGWQ